MIKVVLLHADHAVLTPVRGTIPVDLNGEIDVDSVLELEDSVTMLSAPDGVPDEVVEFLGTAPVPPAFARSPWLRRHRPLVFVDGRCTVAGHTLRYERDYGVYVEDDE
ncbi:hypothetical protein GCM10022243_37950 [Saccharothrix violaceirubra]|uniref:Cas3 C-terminal domain-containing protein n=1 Tax=Saccharothrix violaceirubra TaxID=413306 RepID=A0A7W7T4C5_9PSEU|nr:hypothetical protein [Saccharothrix violaceirubra]MBB4966291.1 hypothetical protein [Saccharothrix violaceirubra]